tara:strand:- start:304 stop:1098 length:795 start_codon:yes stop_codon:yes gene_type:complete
MYIDIAVNLTSTKFESDRSAVVERAHQAGVTHQLILASDLKEAEEVLLLCDTYENLFASVGVHPHQAKTWHSDSLSDMKLLHQHPRVIAVGECGLDYNRNYSSPQQQREAFAAQLEFAVSEDRPLVLHERDAFQDFSALLSSFPVQGVLHCFTSDKKALTYYLDQGLYIGITGWICDERRGQLLQELVSYIPADRLLIETDAPYLLPRDLPHKPSSRRNEPCYLPHIAQRIASLRSQSLDSLSQCCWKNFRTLFPSAQIGGLTE